MSWAADALWVGPAICDRLRAEVPALREVLTIDAVDPAATEPRQDPAAVVLLNAMRPTNANPMRGQTTVSQDWLVLLAVRSVRREPDRHSTLLGPLIGPVVKALQGWQPPGSLRGLAWVPGPRPDYGKDISYFPLMFTIQVVST